MDTYGLRRMSLQSAHWLVGATLGILILALGATPSEAQRKKFYLTKDPVEASAALTACAAGFHMASLWEIRDTTQLKYDTVRGHTTADSGSGPPAEADAWIRTGGQSSASAIAGLGNCLAWTSNELDHNGTTVELEADWSDPASFSSPWSTVTVSCILTRRVWCKQN
jgi:hypothetical protein